MKKKVIIFGQMEEHTQTHSVLLVLVFNSLLHPALLSAIETPSESMNRL